MAGRCSGNSLREGRDGADVQGRKDVRLAMGGRVLVTGASGFIGRHVVASLLEAGVDVTLAVRDRTKLAVDWGEGPRLRVVEVRDLATAELDNLLEDAGAVVHAAGVARADQRSRDEAVSANL